MDRNYTTEVGGCTALYYSLVFQMPKWNYKLKKIDEWMSVSPVHTQSYELTVGQKQKLEGMIKQGLASAAQAVADFELARHDLRKYEEIINYFVRAKGMEKDSKGKKKDKDEHVLRSLFIDRVDAYTGENFSMISMTKRWPTIITDFIRMGKLTEDDKKEIDKIKDKLEVSQAEATVLRTKNEMFDSWQKMFLPEVQKRYNGHFSPFLNRKIDPDLLDRGFFVLKPSLCKITPLLTSSIAKVKLLLIITSIYSRRLYL